MELSLAFMEAKKPIVDCSSHAYPVMGPVCDSEPEICTHSSDPGKGFEISLISRHHPNRVSCHSDLGRSAFFAKEDAVVVTEIAATVTRIARKAHFI